MEWLPVQDRMRNSVLLTFFVIHILNFGSSFDLHHGDDPYFLYTETNVTVHEGELARLKCRVANLGPKTVNVVVWRRVDLDYPVTIGEMPFTPDSGMSVDHSKISRASSRWDLLIKSAKPHHAGVYECHVSASDLIAQYVTLNVIESSRVRSDLKISGTKYVNKGEKLHLVCNATGTMRAPKAVDWFYEGNRIHPSNPKWSGRVEILKHESFEGKYFISELIVDHSQLDDKGHYVCRSSDLTVDSLTVHVLNADKDNLTRRVSGDEAQSGQSGQINTAPDSAATVNRSYLIHVLIFAIIAIVWR